VFDSIEASVGIYLATLIASVLSGLVPVVNGEIYLVAAILLARDPGVGLALALIMAVGQMIAKIVLYHAARGAGQLGRSTRFGDKLERARQLVERWQGKPLTLLFVSSVTGLPPFYLVSLLAGLVGIRFGTFLLLGLAGRAIRFVALALLVLYW
jgi:membrane protein YqaA with SNARE-associated domain